MSAATAAARLCDACLIGKRETPATHYETRERCFVFCGDHALPWDAPLAVVPPGAEDTRHDWPLGRLSEIEGF